MKNRFLAPMLTLGFALWMGSQSGSHAALVGGWAFDEGNGDTTADASGNGNAGTIVGPTWTDGKFGKALNFNGNGDHVFVGPVDRLNLSAVTLAAWAQPTGWNGELNTLVQKWDDGGNKRQLLLCFYQQKPIWYVSDSGENWPSAFGATVAAENEWVHIAGTYDGAMIRVYLNGVLDAETEQASGVFASDTPFMIGGYGPDSPVPYGTNRHFMGLIDEVQVFDAALTAEEIAAVMTSPMGETTAVEPSGKLATAWGWMKTR